MATMTYVTAATFCEDLDCTTRIRIVRASNGGRKFHETTAGLYSSDPRTRGVKLAGKQCGRECFNLLAIALIMAHGEREDEVQ